VLLYVSAGSSASAVAWTFEPLRFPPLPALPALAILIAAVPAFAAPPPIRRRASVAGGSGRADAPARPGDRADEPPSLEPAATEELVA
jgi:hypothetical protein